MKICTEVEWELKDRFGNITRTKKVETHSIVFNFLDIIYSLNYGITISVKDTGNASRTIPWTASVTTNLLRFDAGSTVSAYGLVVGTGTNAVAGADYALQTQIVNGSGAGQLAYSATTNLQAPTTAGTTRSYKIQRTYTNNSGGNITVNEIGIYGRIYDSAGAARDFLMERALSTHTINNGSTGTLTYTISITV